MEAPTVAEGFDIRVTCEVAGIETATAAELELKAARRALRHLKESIGDEQLVDLLRPHIERSSARLRELSAIGTQVRTAAAERRRQDITAVAATLFHDVGYHETGLRQIAAAAGMSKPTLYHYFQSKDDILYAIHDEFIDLMTARHEAMLQKPGSMRDHLREVMSMIVKIIDSHGPHLRVFFEHYRELRPEYREALSIKRDRYFESVQRIVARGVASGEFRPVDVPLVTLGVFGMCNWATNWYRPHGHNTPQEVADTFFDIVVRGLESATQAGRIDGSAPTPVDVP